MLASDPVPTLNQKKADLGIPRDSLKPHPALVPLGTFDLVVLVCERDAHRVSCNQAAIGDGGAMRVAREVRENGFGSAEWLLRIDHPFRSPERDEEGGERFSISELSAAD